MTSVVDQHPTPHGEDDDASGREDRPGCAFSDEFVAEIRELLAPRASRGLFPADEAHDDEPPADSDLAGETEPGSVEGQIGVDEVIVTEEDFSALDAAENRADDGDGSRATIFPERTATQVDTAEPSPIRLFLPRPEVEERRPPSVARVLVSAAEESHAPTAAPKLFVSPTVVPAEVAFVPVEPVGPNRYRWLLIVIGALAILGAIWLTWMARGSDTVDAPVTTVATTLAPTSSTTVAPTTTAVPSTTTTVLSTTVTTESTTTSTVATTAPPATPRPTAPRRPATTARPRTTAAPPTTEAPTIPDLSLPPPTVAPNPTPTTEAPPPPES